jgi:hypothetical protein
MASYSYPSSTCATDGSMKGLATLSLTPLLQYLSTYQMLSKPVALCGILADGINTARANPKHYLITQTRILTAPTPPRPRLSLPVRTRMIFQSNASRPSSITPSTLKSSIVILQQTLPCKPTKIAWTLISAHSMLNTRDEPYYILDLEG